MTMLIHSLLGVMLTSASGAEVGRSARCAALLENQVYVRSETRNEYQATLDEVSVRAEQELRIIYGDANLSTEDILGVSVFLWLNTPPSRRTAEESWGVALSFANIGDRLNDLAEDLYAIRDGVVAGGMILRGADEILPYLERFQEAAIRNELEAQTQRPTSRVLKSIRRMIGPRWPGQSDAIEDPTTRSLIEMVSDAAAYPMAFVYQTEHRILTEVEADELKAAARLRRVPNKAFRARHDAGLKKFSPDASPVHYVFDADLIYFYDEAKTEPVLLVFDRFRREVDAPPPPKRRTEGARLAGPRLASPVGARLMID